MATRAPCPICKTPTELDRAQNKCAPFCSSRCRTIDLGNWLGEAYRIPAVDQDALDEAEGTGRVPPRGERE